MNGISKLLSKDGFIQVNKTLIKQIGLHEAIIIGELCAEYNYWEEQGKLVDDMFYSTRENIENNTGLNDHYQRKAFATLKELGIISIVKKGLPAINYYKIHFDKLLMILSNSATRDVELEVQDIDLNNNKQIKINKKEKKVICTEFEFGGNTKQPKKDNLFTKCVALIDSYDFSCWGNIRNLLIDYLQFRMSIKEKPLYTNMWKGMLNKLIELCDDDISMYESVIKQSIERGYLSFYPISSGSSGLHTESGARHVPRMTQEDYDKEAEHLAELEAQGMQVRF